MTTTTVEAPAPATLADMTPSQLLVELAAHGVKCAINAQERLVVTDNGQITPALKNAVRARHAELAEAIQNTLLVELARLRRLPRAGGSTPLINDKAITLTTEPEMVATRDLNRVVLEAEAAGNLEELGQCRRAFAGFQAERRAAAIAWAREMVAAEFAVVDTESTGTGPGAEIIQIAIVGGDHAYKSYVRPLQAVEAGALAVHGITNAMLADAPMWSEVLQQVAPILADRPVVAYNAEFDSRLIRQTSARYSITAPVLQWSCAMLRYCDFSGLLKWPKLTVACEQMGLPVADAHDALRDCRMTEALVRAMAEVDG